MIEEIIKLCNEDGKSFSLTQECVQFDVLNGKKIYKIQKTDCQNQYFIITLNGKLYETYNLIFDTFNNNIRLYKLCISFEELEFGDQ